MEGQQVTTKYGDGKVLLVSKAKPLVYVRLEGRDGGIYIFSESEVLLADAGIRSPHRQEGQASTVGAEGAQAHQADAGAAKP